MNKNPIIIFFFIILGFFYYLTGSGAILGSNDGSHYALARALFENHDPTLNNRYISYTNYISVAEYRGKFYSDRTPGLALLSSPFYFIGKTVSNMLRIPDDPQKYEMLNIHTPRELLHREFPVTSILILFLLIFTALTGTLSTYLVWKIAKLISKNSPASFLTAIAFALCSLNWKYATLFFSHSLSTFLILSLTYLLLSINLKKEKLTYMNSILIGSVMGLSILTEYFNIVYLLPLFLYSLTNFRIIFDVRRPLAKIIVAFACFSIPVLILLLYQWKIFDDPFKTTYSQHYFYIWARTFKGFFSGNFWLGLTGQLFSQLRNGIFFLSPIVLLSFIGWARFFKKLPKEGLLFLALFTVPIFIMSFAYDWNGGGFDTRYIMVAISFLFLPLSFISFNKWYLLTYCTLFVFSFINNTKLVYNSSKLGFSPHLNFYHWPYLLFTVILFFIVIKITVQKKKNYVFYSILLVSSIFLLISDIKNDWRVLPWNIIYKDNFVTNKFDTIAQSTNISRVATIIYAWKIGIPGSYIMKFDLKKKPKYVILISNFTIASKNSYIKILTGTNLKEVYVLRSKTKNEKATKTFLNLTPFIRKSSIVIKNEFFVDEKYGVSESDARIENIGIVAIY